MIKSILEILDEADQLLNKAKLEQNALKEVYMDLRDTDQSIQEHQSNQSLQH